MRKKRFNNIPIDIVKSALAKIVSKGVEFEEFKEMWEEQQKSAGLCQSVNVRDNKEIKSLYADYYAELELYEREQNTGHCDDCTEIRNRIAHVLEHE